ncbi:MAG TPA: hypothetical protein VES42_19915 [Pilimelia sp.]|nr:hypothetical protein [Pilimelia sp.]
MPRFWPRAALEPPPEYVGFVARHLPSLRHHATLAVDGRPGADELYPAAFEDVAARWRRFELLRTRLGRPDAADDYLHRAFARRLERWRAEQITPVDVVVWQGDRPAADPEPTVSAVAVGPAPAATPPAAGPGPAAGPVRGPAAGPVRGPDRRYAPPRYSSVAERLAPHLRPEPREDFTPLAEASIAWWHAYVARRRRHNWTRLAALAITLAALTRVTVDDRAIFTAPPPGPAPAMVAAHRR